MAGLRSNVSCALLLLLAACQTNGAGTPGPAAGGPEEFHCEGKFANRLVMNNFGISEKDGVAWIDPETRVPAEFKRVTVRFKVDRGGAGEWRYEFNRNTGKLTNWMGNMPVVMDCKRVD